MVLGKWISTHKQMKIEPYHPPYRKINSKWIKDLIIRPETIEFLEENIGEKLDDIVLGSCFLDTSPKAKATKVKLDKCHYIKLKSSCTGNNEQSEKTTYRMGKNICKSYV